MAKQHTLTTDSGTQSDAPVITVRCGCVDILPALKREDSHGTVPLGWNIVVYDVTCS